MNRISDEILMMHGFKGIGNSDILKMHGFNKDPVPYQSINQYFMPEYIYDWSDGTRVIADLNSNLMWTSVNDKVTTIPTQYFDNTAQSGRPFRFYEKDGKKYVISYNQVHDLANHVFHICEIDSDDIRKTRTVTNIKVSLGLPVVTFEYDVQLNKVVAFCSKAIGTSGKSNQVLIDLNGNPRVVYTIGYRDGPTDEGAASCNVNGTMIFASFASHFIELRRFPIYNNTISYILMDSFPANLKPASGQYSRLPGIPGKITQGCFYYNDDERRLSFTENIQIYAPAISKFGTNKTVDWGGTTTSYKLNESYTGIQSEHTFPVGSAPNTTPDIQNLPNIANMQYKWGNDLQAGPVKSILLYTTIKADNPNTIFIHAKKSVFDYETNVDIQISGFTNFNWNNILFKDEQGNILPHFMEPVQPSKARKFVIKQNLNKGWNTFTFEQGSSNTSNGYNVFEEFFDFNDGKPQKWTVPSVYEFHPSLGLIKGVNGTNNTNTDWIELNELPQLGKRYEIGMRAHTNTGSGYFQFGQFNSLFIGQTTLTQDLDGVRCRPKRQSTYSYFSGTINMRNNTQVWGSTSSSGTGYSNFGADIVGFEYGKNRCLVYQYDAGQYIPVNGFDGSGSKVFNIIPNSDDGYGIERVPQNTDMGLHGLKLYRMWNNTETNDGMHYYRRRKAYQGESVTVGFKNTYIIQTANKTFIDIPF